MPELPEAETIVRGLRRSVVGRRIRRVEVMHPDVLRAPLRAFARAARSRTVEDVGRRGKNVLLFLSEDGVLAVNLGMTGRLLPFTGVPRGNERPTHPVVRFLFDDGGMLVFEDQRRFGTVEVLDTAGWAARDARMGPEPLGPAFTADVLARALGGSRSPVRSWLLDQRRIAGIGNIYAVEALHRAGIHPLRRSRELDAGEARRLHGAIRSVLRAAIRHGGTTIRDYRNVDGGEGEYRSLLRVYGREGEPCPRCGTPVARAVLSNRSAYFCPACQPAPERI